MRFHRSSTLSKILVAWMGWVRVERGFHECICCVGSQHSSSAIGEAKALRRHHEERAKRMRELLTKLEKRTALENAVEQSRVEILAEESGVLDELNGNSDIGKETATVLTSEAVAEAQGFQDSTEDMESSPKIPGQHFPPTLLSSESKSKPASSPTKGKSQSVQRPPIRTARDEKLIQRMNRKRLGFLDTFFSSIS